MSRAIAWVRKYGPWRFVRINSSKLSSEASSTSALTRGARPALFTSAWIGAQFPEFVKQLHPGVAAGEVGGDVAGATDVGPGARDWGQGSKGWGQGSRDPGLGTRDSGLGSREGGSSSSGEVVENRRHLGARARAHEDEAPPVARECLRDAQSDAASAAGDERGTGRHAFAPRGDADSGGPKNVRYGAPSASRLT